MSGMLCEERIPPHVKAKSHKRTVQPALLYEMKKVSMTSSHEKRLEVTEIKMCRLSCGHILRMITY